MTNSMAAVVLFDLDGTLVDSAVDLLNAMNVLVNQQDRPALSLSTLRPMVSKGSRAMLSVAFPELSEEAREALIPPFHTAYNAAIADHSTPFAGVAEVLAHIENSGSRWGIVTNKPFAMAQAVVTCMGWQSRCSVLVGGDSLPTKKPDPAQLIFACQTLDVAVSDCVYVGDDERDIQAAHNAGMRAVAALWGYRQAHENPADWLPDALAQSPFELLGDNVLGA